MSERRKSDRYPGDARQTQRGAVSSGAGYRRSAAGERDSIRRSVSQGAAVHRSCSARARASSHTARLGSEQVGRARTEKARPSLAARLLNGLKRVGIFLAGAATGFYHLFDRFRTSESKRIVTNTILAGVLVLLLASVLMLFKPSIDASRAVSAARKSDATEAMQLLSRAEKEGLGTSRLDKTRLQMADAFTSQGRFTLARQLTGEMSDAAKAAQQNAQIDYAEAVSLYNARNFQGAAQLFYRLGAYRDSADKYKDCLCATAVTAYLEGSEARARSLLAELSDAENRLSRICAALGHRELLNDPLFSAESLKHMRESYALLRQSRQASPKGFIAAGEHHSLVLRSNGGVLAQGDNSRGQCNTGTWSGITMVAAGKYHSVGLHADGTVVACGDNTEGQCNVGAWSDIVAVSAGAYVTVGLKRDGSLVWCGRGLSTLDSWQNVQLLTAGGYAVGALNENGTMLCSHTTALLPLDVKMFELSVCSAVSAGILYDGTLISSMKNAPAWQELKSVAVSETGIYALTLSGAVRTHFFRASDRLNININSDAVEIAASGAHALVLMSDGKVYAYGDNTYGQCQVNGLTR